MLDTSANELSVEHERLIAEKIGANREVLYIIILTFFI